MLRWTKLGKTETIKELGSIVPEYQHKNRYVMYFGEYDIKLAYSSQFTNWKIYDKPLLEKREGMFDDGELEVGKVYNLKDHIMVFNDAKKKDISNDAIAAA